MPDLGLEIEDFQAQTWRIENWSKQPRRLQGPEFSCGGHKWWVWTCTVHRAVLIFSLQAHSALPPGQRERSAE